jgi:hypothetical protein
MLDLDMVLDSVPVLPVSVLDSELEVPRTRTLVLNTLPYVNFNLRQSQFADP